MPDTVFRVNVNVAIDDTGIIFHLRAIVEINNSNTYLVHSFVIQNKETGDHLDFKTNFLSEVKIKTVQKNGVRSWVDFDSSKESDLARAIGEAIEKEIKPDQI